MNKVDAWSCKHVWHDSRLWGLAFPRIHQQLPTLRFPTLSQKIGQDRPFSPPHANLFFLQTPFFRSACDSHLHTSLLFLLPAIIRMPHRHLP